MKHQILLLICLLGTAMAQAQTPLLSSNPSSAYVLMLDADGFTDNSMAWSDNPALKVATSGYTTAQITELFLRISEDYRPFNINVTTSEAVYQAALVANRQRVVFTPTDTFFNKNGTNAGGVAYVGAFGGGEVPCWVFTNKMGGSSANSAEAGAHELGHTVGLSHHGQFTSACALTSGYSSGQGSGQTSWCPIMGAAYGRTISQWYKGASTSCSAVTDDLSLITTSNGFTYRPDDVGNTNATATALTATATGLITTTVDVDVYSFTAATARSYSFALTPNAYNAITLSGANLDARLTIRDAAGNLVADLQPLATLNATATVYLNAGTYYLTVDGAGVANYIATGGTGSADYGSLGQYTLSVTQPICAAGLASVAGASRCDAGSVTLTATAPAAITGGNITWYADATTTAALATGASYATPSLAASTTYYVEFSNGACAAGRVPVNATIGGSTTVQPITGTASVGIGSTITLTNATTGGTWKSSDTTIAKVNATGIVTGRAAGTATITYTVQTGTCPAVSVTAAVTVTSASPKVVSIVAGSRCGSGTVTLSATASAGSAIQWFAAAQGGAALATGGTFTTPTLTRTTYYYAQAVLGSLVSARAAVYARIDSTFTPGILAQGNQTVCYSGDPATISPATAGTGGSSASYQWYYRSGIASAPTGSATTGWTAIPAATAASYDPPALLTASRTYAVFVTPAGGVSQGSSCAVAQWATGVRQVTVLPAFTPGTVTAGDQTFCKSGNPSDITLSANPVGSGGFTWRWYYVESSAGACPSGSPGSSSSPSSSGWLTNNSSAGITGTTYTGAGIHLDPISAGTVGQGRTFALMVTPIANGAIPACGAATWASTCRKTVVTNCVGREGLDEGEVAEASILVYPNPAQEQFTVSVEGLPADQPALLHVLDAQGRSVFTQSYGAGTNQFSVPSAQWAQGVYQVIVTARSASWRTRVTR